ncbi:MAG: dihydrofolate reductase [Oscillibacter sp.]|nr:dihydrofolate reductase [Oscillibacter sp.]
MNAIVVVDRNWAIGREGGLLFTLPTDMKRFKDLTMGGTIIMGRKTLESFPGGKLLDGRRNIVISHSAENIPPEASVVKDPEAAVEKTYADDPDKVWVIGGGSVYAALLGQCRRVYLTKVDAVAEGEPDTYFPNLDHLPYWEVESASDPVTENGLTYRFVQYINRNLDEEDA